MHCKQWLLTILLLLGARKLEAAEPLRISFDADWRFLRADEPQARNADFDDQAWETATLPHTANLEALVTGQGARQWQGICWYRKAFNLSDEVRNKEIFLRFEGAMNVADIWVNGKSAGHFMGGYLPYVMDISKLVRPAGTNVVAVRLDNRDNPVTGPKPLATLDFNLYGGLYRSASMIIKDKLHITDPILDDRTAGGGVFVTFPAVSKEEATVHVQTQVRNADQVPRAFAIKTTLVDPSGRAVASSLSALEELPAGDQREVVQEIHVPKPKLWSPQSPDLYHVRSELLEHGKPVDVEQTRIGIRRIQIGKDGFCINGEKVRLRGVNRHQEYPYVGYAVNDDAQYRDAWKIKQAGFDCVRLSHYPQSPAFLDACDELGLVVMDSVLGWQYFGKDPAFAELKYQECRQLVRRDRNHPCVILWEVSLNESSMPGSFVEQAHAITHQEYPGDQCYTCGWVDGYDVFIQARQHGGCRAVTNRPCLVSEYGDWEYYALNAGLEQNKWKDLEPGERSSRQLRGDGEVRLLQQALNFQEAHNDNLKTTAFADALWVMYDYNRGYAPDLESSGVMDIFRLPKFSYWFFRSQRDPGEQIEGSPLGPVVFIANYWTPRSPLDVRVFSNCQEVGLYLNHHFVERRRPDVSRVSSNLKHAPFTFKLDRFQPGTLTAIGYMDGREAARDERHTPGEVDRLTLRLDTSGRPFAANGKDTVFCYADLRDKARAIVPDGSAPVFFGATGQTRLIGSNPILSEAGTATILLESDIARPVCAAYAICFITQQDQTRILSTALSPDGAKPPDFSVHYTTDGSDPGASSPRYSGPIRANSQLRAAIFVNSQAVACADARAKAVSTSERAVLTANAADPPQDPPPR
jgi:beta-galactosidase